jgi:hypothetical protein
LEAIAACHLKEVPVKHFWLVCALAILCPAGAQAQINGSSGGIAPFGSYTDDPLGVINVANLNVHTVIPIRNKNGFVAQLQNENLMGQYFGQWQPSGAWFALLTSASSGRIAPSTWACSGGTTGTPTSIDRSGFLHIYPVTLTTNGCNGYPTSGTGTDKYGWTYSGSLYFGSVTDPSGGVYNGNSVVDANGNQFTYTGNSSGSYTDPTNATFLTVVGGTNNAAQYSWSDTSGATKTIAVITTAYVIHTSFGCKVEYQNPNNWLSYLPTRISLPDNSSYSIAYEQTPGYGAGTTTGRIKSITLPTGGVITYTYNGANHGISCQDGGNSGFTRTGPDGTWSYSRSFNSTTSLWTTVITSPSGQKVATMTSRQATGLTTN